MARLHGPNRTQEVEAGFRRWLGDDPEHASAFELLTDTWEKSARLRRHSVGAGSGWRRIGARVGFSRMAFATAAAAAVLIPVALFFFRSDAVTTGIGELRTLVLDDATRLYLNANTRVRVHYDKQFRRVTLERGEALFEVAKRPDWPFVVSAGGREIRALGTSFDVRRDEQDLVVTLVEGKVTVTPKSEPTLEQKPFVLSPGQRLTFAKAGPATIDRPPLERVTAWKLGQVNLDNTPLADAVAEMNRYSRQRIVIDDPSVAAIRVSGIFIAGDSANFAHAVGKAYRLRVLEQSPELIVLSSGKE
jgi:transmembrane sensor